MPYYSVRITGGDDFEAAAREIREMFSGTDADYTGCLNFFYVQRSYELAKLKANIDGALQGKYDVDVKKIKKDEFFWRGGGAG